MLRIWLIRHGMTEGNKHARYIGVTDEPLCAEGKQLLQKMSYPVPQVIFASPLLRCRETSALLFPGMVAEILDELAECDFGIFENKNYKELAGNAEYQAWIDSNGILPFPGGESREAFKKRSAAGFQKAVDWCLQEQVEDAALVTHGGTIMNIMEEYAVPYRSFYQWHVKNGGGYLVRISETDWKNGRKEVHLEYAVMEG